LRWSGFIIFDHIADFPAAATELTRLAARKEIVFDEEILVGLEQAPLALASLYRGANRGKLVVSLIG
jgi:NADPH-dependent curcumin reductase CurA